ncbi:MAG: ABC transporter ATP-binding protein [Lachnospiraceae bacterium]|nr:ABC transporter ATP-binding protein [Lachnospiraceae bacterium]
MSSKNNSKEENRQSWHQFLVFFKNTNFSWGWILLSTGLTIVYYFTYTLVPGNTAALFGGQFTDQAIKGVLVNYSVIMVMLLLIGAVSVIAEAKSVRSVRKSVWKRMMGIKTSYYDEHGANYLLSAVTSDTQLSVSSLISVITVLPGQISYLAKAIPQINGFSPKLVWAIVILIPVYVGYAFLIGRWQYKVGMTIQGRIGTLTGYLSDRIRNLSLIKSFGTEEKEEAKGLEASKELYQANIEFGHMNAVIVAYTIGAEVLGTILAVVWGSILLKNQEITTEEWLTFFLFAPTINTVLRQLSTMWSTLKDVQGRASRLGALMEAPREDMNENAPEAVTGDIRFEAVDFSYNEKVQTLKKMDLVIPEGKTTAIVGPSGSGKTTVLRLIESLYTPQSGSITVGGTPLKDMNLCSWRDKLSYVNQIAELFSGTVREALTYGLKRPVTDEELENAAKTADIYDFIMTLPGGFDAELSLWGGSMSGGQRQRMVIARELLRQAQVLLLDEPTSALDPETASSVADTFFSGFEGKTIVAVTHELGYIARADQIIVMNEGEVIDKGTHEELMERCDLYRILVEEQSYQEVFA